MGSTCCEHCTAVCCRYLALPLDRPQNPRDFDDIRWYLMHEGILVFVEEGDWYVQMPTRCRSLRPDNLCTVYRTRPKICREYKAGQCDYIGGSYGYEHLFTCVEDLDAYLATRRAARNGRQPPARRSAARTRSKTDGRS